MQTDSSFKSGFVSIIGKPNVGKSTLLNQMMGEKVSITTSKAQTTRHRIMGILSQKNYQIIYSDTPGIINPEYPLHKSMMKFVKSSLKDADIIILMVDIKDKYDDQIGEILQKINVPIIFILNKVDLSVGTQAKDKMTSWQEKVKADAFIQISAIKNENIDLVINEILKFLPIHPPYFPLDQMSDKPMRFFASEIIREKIFLNYRKEIPYSTEVNISSFEDTDELIRIEAQIFVERNSQKGIIIGHKGESLKKVGIESRKELESFFQKKIFLKTIVKVAENWRKLDFKLKQFGYNN